VEVLTLYVGQGNLTVVRHGTQAIVVDTRWLAERSEDIESKISRFLQRRDLSGIVLTGLDDDHADPVGLDWLLENYEPNWVMYPKYYKDTENAQQVFNVIRKHERRRKGTQRPLERISVRLDRLESRYLDDLTDEFQLELFSPHIEDMDNSNNCSIVLKIEGIGPGGFSYLVTGDTENPRWDRIVDLFGDALDADVLAAPHHGSKNAAHPGMILEVRPHTVVISAGVDNQYGHPDRKAVALYLRVAAHVFQTNVRNGISLLTYRRGRDLLTRPVA
jgi:beta-lactamase superfamily II metal-dependent hydrolase